MVHFLALFLNSRRFRNNILKLERIRRLNLLIPNLDGKNFVFLLLFAFIEALEFLEHIRENCLIIEHLLQVDPLGVFVERILDQDRDFYGVLVVHLLLDVGVDEGLRVAAAGLEAVLDLAGLAGTNISSTLAVPCADMKISGICR